MAVDQDKLSEFLGRFVGDLGATMAAGNIVIGHRLGLYRALVLQGQMYGRASLTCDDASPVFPATRHFSSI